MHKRRPSRLRLEAEIGRLEGRLVRLREELAARDEHRPLLEPEAVLDLRHKLWRTYRDRLLGLIPTEGQGCSRRRAVFAASHALVYWQIGQPGRELGLRLGEDSEALSEARTLDLLLFPWADPDLDLPQRTRELLSTALMLALLRTIRQAAQA